MEAVRGVHPRLYVTESRLNHLREATGTTHASLWKAFLPVADRVLREGPPQYNPDEDGGNKEQLWQRNVGNAMATLAAAYRLSDDDRYLDGARDWALASCGYPTWGLDRLDGLELAAGHQMFGLAIVYDWCFEALGEETRSTIRETLIRRTEVMFEAAAAGEVWWHRKYLHNHLWVKIAGMAAVGLALFDEHPDALKWIGLPLDKFRKSVDALGTDGASNEGVGYWGYGLEYLLKFVQLARELLGVEMYDHDWFRRTTYYRLFMALPRNAWTPKSNIVDIADCPRGNWYGPDYLLRRLAAEFRNGHAQWLADALQEAKAATSEARWLNLVWFDPGVESMPPTDLPTLRHFDDLDLVSARSGWSGHESLLVHKCGPFIGHHAIERFDYEPGGSHVHPDANHFSLFGCGEWLMRDDGYQEKWTGQHNTLLVDGRGQIGEGKIWFGGPEAVAAKSRPRITRALPGEAIDVITGDATDAYPSETGLERFVRHLIFVKPDVLIVIDDIAADRERDLELRFHPEQQEAESIGDAYLVRGKNAMLRIEPLTMQDVKVSAEALKLASLHKGDGLEAMFTVRLRKSGTMWRNVVAISWSASGDPAVVGLKEGEDRWTFSVGERTVEFDWADATIEYLEG